VEEREKEIQGTGEVSVDLEDPLEWSSEKVTILIRSLGTTECFQSPGDQVLEWGVDDSTFFGLFKSCLTPPRGWFWMCGGDRRISPRTEEREKVWVSHDVIT
jgi:hypothetical protein